MCTTECFLDGYAIEDKSIPLDVYRALGETIPGGVYHNRLAALARELKIHMVAGMLEADGEARYNTAALISPAGDRHTLADLESGDQSPLRCTTGSDYRGPVVPYRNSQTSVASVRG